MFFYVWSGREKRQRCFVLPDVGLTLKPSGDAELDKPAQSIDLIQEL